MLHTTMSDPIKLEIVLNIVEKKLANENTSKKK